MVTTSACRKSSSFVTISAPAAAAVSAVKFRLQAMIFMPNARPILATSPPEDSPIQFVADRGLPAAGPDRVAFSDEVTGAGQDQRPGQFDCRRRSVARVGDYNAPLVRSGHIDGDVARARRS